MFKPLLNKLVRREDLSATEIESVFDAILQLNEVSVSDGISMGALLSLLRAKGESPTEIAAMVRSMKKYCIPVVCKKEITSHDGVEICDIGCITLTLHR